MKTFRYFLIWCSNRDVVPILEALHITFLFYKNRNIDMFKDSISVPRLTLKFLLNALTPDVHFYLFNENIKAYTTHLRTD